MVAIDLFWRVQVTWSASADAADRHGNTAATIAAQQGHADVVAELLSAKADADGTRADGCAPLHLASQHGRTSVIAKLLQTGQVDVNRADNDGYTYRP